METKLLVLGGYALAVLVIGGLARTRLGASPASYFLADRRLGGFVLLATMAATNFSAFTVFGVSGAGYRDGWSFFPIMGFGTGFMALSFWVIGRRAWRIGREQGLITPAELVEHRYASPALSVLFSLTMIVFTLPYLALQPLAAGYALEELLGLPPAAGAAIVAGLVVLYTLRGGLRAVAWTDLFQGVLFFGLLVSAAFVVAHHHGGFAAASREVLARRPELFARPGAQGFYLPGVWFSYLALWFFCDPMFPQLFQRFFAARDERAIGRMMIAYPLLCTVLFAAPVAVGVLGRLSFPDLSGKQADRILPLVLSAAAGDLFAALVVAAGLAALMSTMDSQLLTLSSLFTRDLLPRILPRRTTGTLPGRLFVVGLALAGWALSLEPPATILEIATASFTGLAVLFPTVFFGLYSRRPPAAAAAASILTGEAALFAFQAGGIDPGPVLPVVWVMALAFAAYGGVWGAGRLRRGRARWGVPAWLRTPWVPVQAAIFVLAHDFWAWGEAGPLVAGVPAWALYFAGLSLLQTAAMAVMVRGGGRAAPALQESSPASRRILSIAARSSGGEGSSGGRGSPPK
ncbi:MAG: sodium:solute symporter family protein [Desulfobacterales bacterium]